jgi:hypothetical protein
MSRPPNKPRQDRIKQTRIYVAKQIKETGAPPAIRSLAEALGYASGGSARTYDAVRKLTDDPTLIYVKTSWQNYIFPIEIFEAMVKAAEEVLEKETKG